LLRKNRTLDCEVTASDRETYVYYLNGNEYDASGRQTFGWVEKDGELGDNTGPTSPEETVYVGQILDPGVVVNLNPCFRWSPARSYSLALSLSVCFLPARTTTLGEFMGFHPTSTCFPGPSV